MKSFGNRTKSLVEVDYICISLKIYHEVGLCLWFFQLYFWILTGKKYYKPIVQKEKMSFSLYSSTSISHNMIYDVKKYKSTTYCVHTTQRDESNDDYCLGMESCGSISYSN